MLYSYLVESWLNEAPSTHVEVFFLAPNDLSVGVGVQKLSDSVVCEGSNLFESKDSGILIRVISLISIVILP